MMIAEEEDLRGRLVSSIESCRRDLDALCRELQLPLFIVSPEWQEMRVYLNWKQSHELASSYT